jgi:hypothetical protein
MACILCDGTLVGRENAIRSANESAKKAAKENKGQIVYESSPNVFNFMEINAFHATKPGIIINIIPPNN